MEPIDTKHLYLLPLQILGWGIELFATIASYIGESAAMVVVGGGVLYILYYLFKKIF